MDLLSDAQAVTVFEFICKYGYGYVNKPEPYWIEKAERLGFSVLFDHDAGVWIVKRQVVLRQHGAHRTSAVAQSH
jgi:hypothetical protein